MEKRNILNSCKCDRKFKLKEFLQMTRHQLNISQIEQISNNNIYKNIPWTGQIQYKKIELLTT